MSHLNLLGLGSPRYTPLSPPPLLEPPGQLQLPSAAAGITPRVDRHAAARPRNHGCSECGNRFLRRQDLERHATTHSTARVFVCPLGCAASFRRSDGLTRHVRRGTCGAKNAARHSKARKGAVTLTQKIA
ncbi:hypothetical protein HDU84_006787 [Entophlyctis sp. JEL0112]|nr:hypothetical protein HDU84_006787 [Entophlyctis sp. JEL0112]